MGQNYHISLSLPISLICPVCLSLYQLYKMYILSILKKDYIGSCTEETGENSFTTCT